MNLKKVFATALVTMSALIAGAGLFADTHASFDPSTTAGLTQYTQSLTASGGVIVVEDDDITTVEDAGTNYLSSAFQILKFLGIMALISAGFLVLNKVMSIVPTGGGRQ